MKFNILINAACNINIKTSLIRTILQHNENFHFSYFGHILLIPLTYFHLSEVLNVMTFTCSGVISVLY